MRTNFKRQSATGQSSTGRSAAGPCVAGANTTIARRGLRSLFGGLLALVLGLLAAAPLALVAAPLALVAAPLALADDAKEKGPAYRVLDVSQVFVGNPRLFKKPCAVDADRVYKAIPEYQEILAKNLTDRDVRYHFLMKKASDKFARAVRALAKEAEYDLVAGAGAVVPATADAPAVPNGTDGVISRLPA